MQNKETDPEEDKQLIRIRGFVPFLLIHRIYFNTSLYRSFIFLTSSNVISHRKKSPILSVAQNNKTVRQILVTGVMTPSLTSVGQGF